MLTHNNAPCRVGASVLQVAHLTRDIVKQVLTAAQTCVTMPGHTNGAGLPTVNLLMKTAQRIVNVVQISVTLIFPSAGLPDVQVSRLTAK